MENLMDRITLDPKYCGGQACLRQVRIPVATVLKMLAAGMANSEILAEYPDLASEDIQACLSYAAWIASERVLPPAA